MAIIKQQKIIKTYSDDFKHEDLLAQDSPKIFFNVLLDRLYISIF